METLSKIIFFLLLISGILFISCKNDINQPITGPNENIEPHPIFYNFGLDKSVREYLYTVSKVNLTSNEAIYYASDSIMTAVKFPDSLKNKGIFIYGTMREKIEINDDTMFVDQNEEWYNLIYYHGNDGTSSGGITYKYIADSSNIYTIYSDINNEKKNMLSFKIPFIIGDTYQAFDDTLTVIEEVEIQTKAGKFNTIKVRKSRMLNLNLRRNEIIYFVENIGICLHEIIYVEKILNVNDGSEMLIEEYQRYELMSFTNKY
jgi:hypothetical protein